MAFNNNTNTTGTNVPPGGDHKPSVGEKISGTLDTITGKLTKNPDKVAEGEAKKRGDTAAAQHHDAAADANKHTGAGAHTGTGSHHTGVGTGDHSHTGAATGAGLGATGAGVAHGHHDNTHSSGLGHKAPGEPTLGDKVKGNYDAAAGRATNDPAQYAAGQERKTDTSAYGATGAGAGAGYGSGIGNTGSTATGTGLDSSYGSSGTGLTGSHGHTGTGTGLTGSHGHTGTGTGLTGSHGHTGAGYDNNNTGAFGNNNHNNNNASATDKLSGGVDKLVGKATGDQGRVIQGEAKQQGHDAYPHHTGTAGGIGGHSTGFGTGTGAGHTGPTGNTGATY